MTQKFRIDCFSTGTSVAAPANIANEIFITCYNFLKDVGPTCGVSLVESNWGRLSFGLDYWDVPSARAGPGAFAVFRFNSSSYGSFDMMLTVASASSVVLYSAAPMIVRGQSTPGSTGGFVGISFAAHPSGSVTSPWNGTTGSFVSGTIGNPVWKTDPVGKLAVFPRNNVFANGMGLYSSLRNCMDDIADMSSHPMTKARHHYIMTEDSFTVVASTSAVADTGDLGGYQVTHFGSYTSRPNYTPECKYAMIVGSRSTVDGLFIYNGNPATEHGEVTAGTVGAIDGGICTPILSPSATRKLIVTTIGGVFPDSNLGRYNTFVNSGSFEALPLFVGLKEGPEFGIVGYFNHLWAAFNVANGTVDTTSSSCVFGGSSVGGSVPKFVTRWTGTYPSGSITNRVGSDR